MTITIKQRLELSFVLSSLKGSYDQTKEMMKMKKQLELSKEEMELIEYKQENGNVVWNPTKDPNKEIELNKEIIKKAVDDFKAEHEAKQDFNEALVLVVDGVEELTK